MARYYSGNYTPTNKEKYIGDVKKITFRSFWEYRTMKWLDLNEDIEKWASEEIIVQYFFEGDNKWHRYFPDFYVKYKTGEEKLVEIKPAAQEKIPKKSSKKHRKTRINETLTYVKNQNKWKAAEEYAKKRNWRFVVWTEKELFALKILHKGLKPLKKIKVKRKKIL